MFLSISKAQSAFSIEFLRSDLRKPVELLKNLLHLLFTVTQSRKLMLIRQSMAIHQKIAHFQKSIVQVWNVLPSQGSDCSDHSSFCTFSSSGQDGRASRSPRGQVSVYRHLSLRSQDHNSLLLRSRSAKDLPDTTAFTWSQCTCKTIVYFLSTNSTLCSTPLQP